MVHRSLPADAIREQRKRFIAVEGRSLFVATLGTVASCRPVLEDLRDTVVPLYQVALADVLEADGLALPADDEVAALDISEGEPRWLNLVVNVLLPVVGRFIERPELPSPPRWPVLPAAAVASARTAGVALRRWSDLHRARDAWLRDLISVVCSRWALDRAAAECFSTDSGEVTHHDPDAARVTFEDRGWSPGLESWEHFEAAAVAAFTAALRAKYQSQRAGRPRTPNPHAIEGHLAWLARWHFGRETQAAIAADVGRERTVVSRGVRVAAKRIGLTL